MPLRRRSAPRRYRKKPNRRVRRKAMRKPSEAASLTECISIANFQSNLFAVNTFGLNQFPRASQIAGNYKMYKAAYCEWTYTPQFNQFPQGNNAGNSTMPYLYSQMNRTQDSTPGGAGANAKAFLESAGVVPQLFNKKKVIKYVPNWCSPGLLMVQGVPPGTNPGSVYQVATAGLQIQKGWLAAPANSTNIPANRQNLYPVPAFPNNVMLPQENMDNVVTNIVQYNGHNTFFRQDSQVASQSIGFLTLKVKWLFKGPGNRTWVGAQEELGNTVDVQPDWQDAIPDANEL